MSNTPKELEPKRYKEKLKSNLYEKINKSGENPNRISIDIYSYNGEYVNKKKNAIVAYSGEKIKISDFDLVLEDGQLVNKKIGINGRITNSVESMHLSIENLQDISTFLQSEESMFEDGVFYTKDYQNISGEKSYPKNRIELKKEHGTVVFSNFTLTSENGKVVKEKILIDNKVFDRVSSMKMSIEDFASVKTYLETLGETE